jgi:hypothetical protein
VENNFEIRRLIQDELEKCGVVVPVEEKFDYSGFDKPDLMKQFIKLCNGNWRHTIYVKKYGQRYDDEQYFDLLFVVNDFGHPICIPVPLARKLFNEEIGSAFCLDMIKGYTYELIYKYYYTAQDLPF